MTFLLPPGIKGLKYTNKKWLSYGCMLINVNQAVQNSSEVIPHPSNKTSKKYKTRTILNSDKNVKQLRINWKKKKVRRHSYTNFENAFKRNLYFLNKIFIAYMGCFLISIGFKFRISGPMYEMLSLTLNTLWTFGLKISVGSFRIANIVSFFKNLIHYWDTQVFWYYKHFYCKDLRIFNMD